MVGFAGFPKIPELQKKGDHFVAMAPATYLGYQKSPFLSVLANSPLEKIATKIGLKSFDLLSGAANLLFPGVCKGQLSTCNKLVELITGPSQHLNRTRLPFLLSIFPSTTSMKNIYQYSQSVKGDWFKAYDYGTKRGNLRR